MNIPGSLLFEKVTTPELLQAVFDIRRRVFIEEQNVDPTIEYDKYEESAVHYILTRNGDAIGCARYRMVGDSIKLERIAVLKEERGKGYGRFIMDRMLDEVLSQGLGHVYLHSQTVSVGFYEKCGFVCCGAVFSEADIDHIKMVYIVRRYQDDGNRGDPLKGKHR